MAGLVQRPVEQLRIFHIGGYWRGDNDIVRQMMLGLGRTGATVVEYNTDEHPEALDPGEVAYDRGTSAPVWLRMEQLAQQLSSFDPHLIICNAGGLGFRPDDAARLRERCCLLGIALSDPDVFAPVTRHIAASFDLFLTNDPTCVDRYRALGAASELLLPATNEQYFHPVAPVAAHRCEVLVLGRAHPDRVEPMRRLHEQFHLHLYGEGWQEHGLPSRGLLHGPEVLQALASAAVVPVFFLTRSGAPLVKGGLFDFLAARSLVMTNYFPDVDQYLRYEKEIIGFSSTEELLTKIRHCLDHPEQAEAIRQAGHERVLRDYTWPQVWRRILTGMMVAGP